MTRTARIPNWAAAEFDDSKWAGAKVFTPQLRISSDKTEPNRVVQTIEPIGVTEVSNGVYLIDMGRNYAGWFSMELVGQPGDRISFQFSERENQPMTHRLHSACILGPQGKGTFRNRFNYSSGRWVQVTGLRSKPDLSAIRGGLARTDYARAGSFKSDQPLLNQIYDTTLWTFENLSLGSYVVDCPQRERMGYGGDAHATTRTALANYGLGAFYTKWIEDWRDVQAPDGNLPYTSPTYWGGGGPGWSGFCITLPWEMYQQYGDVLILEENFPMMERWLAFLETKAKDNLLVRWGGEWDFLGDWLWPGAKGVNGDTRETLFFNNCYWIFNLQTAAEIAKVLGNMAAAEKYSARAAQLRTAVHAAFYQAADQSYVNGFPAYLAIALLTEVPPADLREGVWKRLEKEILITRKGHIHAGITGGAFLFKVLMENGRDDLIYTMLTKEDYPGWGDMLKRGGATTFFEDWDFKESFLHSSYLYPGAWFIQGLGGIRPGEKGGFKEFVIEPWIEWENGPREVETHYDSIYGRIVSNWTKNGNQMELRVTVPPNTQASLKVRGMKPGSLRERGAEAHARTIPGSTADTVLSLVPGSYVFVGSK